MQPVIIDELRFHSASDAGELGTNISEQGCFAQRDVESFDSNFEIKDGVPYSVKTGYAVYDSSYSLAAHGAMVDQTSLPQPIKAAEGEPIEITFTGIERAQNQWAWTYKSATSLASQIVSITAITALLI